jgi:hypothetical protein
LIEINSQPPSPREDCGGDSNQRHNNQETERRMDLVCTWDGKYFGWIDSGGLFAADGRHVGEFRKENIFSENGLYLGELMRGRLITNSLKKETHTSLGFWPTANPDAAPSDRPADEAPREMLSGHEAFPAFALKT